MVKRMMPDELLSQFSIKIYEPPLSELRDSGTIRNLSDPIAVMVLIVDFETEVTMNGINNFIGNSTGLFADETVAALKIIGCTTQADQLQRILDIATAAGMTYATIQQDRSQLAPYAITSFSELHGDKWDTANAAIQAIDVEIDYSQIMMHAETFVALHANAFHVAVGR